MKELASDGIVKRTDYGDIPLRVDYSLTPFGESLLRAMEPICSWGEAHEEDIAAAMGRRKASQ